MDGKLTAVEMQLYNNGGNTLDLSDAVSSFVNRGTAMHKKIREFFVSKVSILFFIYLAGYG